MSDRTICYRTRKENFVAQLKESLTNSAWSRMVYADEWSCRIAELEERVVSAERYAASMIEIAEKAQDNAEELGSLRRAEEVVEINPSFRITWGSAVCPAEIKAEKYVAMAEIARGKVELAQARVVKTRISAELARGMRESS